MKLLGKVGVVSAMTGISRIFGLVREIVMANFFGTSVLQSAFVIAFRIPNLFRRLFGEGALGAAFIPVFAEVERQEGQARAQLFLARLLGLLICTLGLLIGVGILITFGVGAWLSEDSQWVTAMPMMRIVLPYALLICVAAMLSGVLNIHDRFAISSLTPVVLNLVWIGVLVGICPFLPEEGLWRIHAVCWGIFAAGFAQICFQLPELKRVGYSFRLAFRGWRESPYIRQVLLQMGPATFGIALAQINICLDGWLAFYGSPWGPAALEYADRIIYLPLGLFGTAFATVLLPTYSRQFAAQEIGALTDTMARALRSLFLIMSPMVVGLLLLAAPTVSVIYERGLFGADSVLYTARAVAAYAPGLLIFSVNKAVVPVFYARKDLRTPVRIASWCILGNVTLNLLSVLFLPQGWRHVGIAGSTVVTSLANTLILFRLLRKQGLTPALAPLLASLFKSLITALLMGVAVFFLYPLLGQWLHKLPALLLTIALGACVYFPCVFLLDPSATREALADFPVLKRLFRKRPAK